MLAPGLTEDDILSDYPYIEKLISRRSMLTLRKVDANAPHVETAL
jgi:hypothetical protein